MAVRFYLFCLTLAVVGVAAVVAGVAMWSVPAACVVGGTVLVVAAGLGLVSRNTSPSEGVNRR